MAVHQLKRHVTAVGTNFDTYFPSGGLWINTLGASSITLLTRRFADTGTCTLLAFVEQYEAATGLFMPLLDLNDATEVQGVVYADGVVDTSTPFHRFLTLNELKLAPGATTVAAVNTVHKAYQVWIPEQIRFRFRHGGTSVSNDFAASCQVHTAYSRIHGQ